MAIDGELHVTLGWDGARVQQVSLRSTRPQAVSRLLAGRTPRAAAELVSRLYGICGCAQGAASGSALEAAQGREATRSVRAAREAALRLEIVQEHCWRLGIDWANAMQSPPLLSMVREARAVLAPALARLMDHGLGCDDSGIDAPALEQDALRALEPLVQRVLLGMSARAWLDQEDPASLERWQRSGVAPAGWYRRLVAHRAPLGASDVALMPEASRDAVLAAVLPGWRDEEGFDAAPAWSGLPVETGALARMRDHPLVAALLVRDGNTVAARLVARLTELAALLAGANGVGARRPWLEAFELDGEGHALTQTARGLLMHRATVEQGVVGAYAMLAPTEWNFRRDGAFARAARNIVAQDAATLEREARLVARAIDPCVACEIEVEHA